MATKLDKTIKREIEMDGQDSTAMQHAKTPAGPLLTCSVELSKAVQAGPDTLKQGGYLL